MIKKLAKKYPKLGAALKCGQIWLEGSEYVGRASDGTIVSLGQLWNESAIESYLTARPNPSQW